MNFKYIKLSLLLVFLFLLFTLNSCEKEKTGQNINKTKPIIYTTFYPTEYFTKRIVGNLAEVINPVPADADPIFWKPSRKEIEAFQKADWVIINGADYEKWLNQVTLPQEIIIDTTKKFEKDFIYLTSKATHSHGPAGKHSHEGLDGHTWLDPAYTIAQAKKIANVLRDNYPEQSLSFENNFKKLEQDLNQLNEKLILISQNIKKQKLLASHPAYNYIGRRYGWQLINLDLASEKIPDSNLLTELKKIALKNQAKYLIWETMPTKEIVEIYQKETGLKSILFSPCETISEEQRKDKIDYLKLMSQNIQNLALIK